MNLNNKTVFYVVFLFFVCIYKMYSHALAIQKPQYTIQSVSLLCRACIFCIIVLHNFYTSMQQVASYCCPE